MVGPPFWPWALLANLHIDCIGSNSRSRRMVNVFICPINLLFMLKHLSDDADTCCILFQSIIPFPNFPQWAVFPLFSHTRNFWAAINYNTECSIAAALPWQSPGHAPTHAPNVQLKCPLTGCDKNQREKRNLYWECLGTIKTARSRGSPSQNRLDDFTDLGDLLNNNDRLQLDPTWAAA